METLLISVALFLAFVNGANDNFKGFATVAASLGVVAYRLLNLRPKKMDCACVVTPAENLAPGAAVLSIAVPRLVIAEDTGCDSLAAPSARFSIAHVLDRLHIFSAGLICFARGVNDTPKLAALLMAGHMVNAGISVLLIAAVMAAGGWLFARRVAETMSRRVTRMDHTQGVAANFFTATLVLIASQLDLPVSSTHVSVGSIAGVGASANTLYRDTLRKVLLSWVATLPMAAGIAWMSLKLL